jgi:DNA-binding transcriptional LysR family regulator
MMAEQRERSDMLELYELSVFVQAAETMSFTAAAQRLHISQPAVSMQINNLEKRLNVLLFDRSGRNIRRTEAADMLLPLAREILNYAAHIEETMASLHGKLSGHLQLGCSTSGGRYLLPHLIARFRQKHPNVRVTVGICTPDGAVDQVCDGRAQLSILSSEAASRDVESRPFFEDQVVLIVPNDHPWAGVESISPKQLAGQPFILREETAGTRRVMQLGLLDHDVRIADLDTVMELGSAEAIVTAVEAGIGIAFISRLVARRSIEAGHVVEVRVTGLDLKRPLLMIRHSRRAQTRAQAAFWDFCNTKEIKEFLQSVA